MQTLIVFSHLRWHFIYQRPQHLLTRLAQRYRVIYVEEPVKDPGQPRFERTTVAPQVELLKPLTPLEASGFHDDQLSVLKPMLDEFMHKELIDDYLVWFYTPMALPLLAQMRPRAVVYDCLDDWSALAGAPRQLQQREAALLKLADLVLTSGPSLYEAKREVHPHVLCLPSAVDAHHYAPNNALAHTCLVKEARALQAHIPHPRLGFFGVIDERLNCALLRALARANPAWHIVMVGPVVSKDAASLPQEPNIHWIGPQRHELLPQIMTGWDICILPLAVNEATRYTSPSKVLEYMAAEKPIVSTPLSDVVSMYGDVVEVAADTADFIAACECVLNESRQRRAQRMSDMLTSVSRFSWEQSVSAILAELDEQLAHKAQTGVHMSPPLTSQAEVTRPFMSATSRRSTRRERLVVVGAGPTGLSAAYHLGLDPRGEDTLLIERHGRVGGGCRSIEDKGFTFDHAGHVMSSDDPDVLSLYGKLLGDNVHWQDRQAWVYTRNGYTRYPIQSALHGLPQDVLKACLIGAIEARFGALHGAAQSTPPASPPANFRELIERTWGEGLARHFMLPYNEKLWGVPLEEMEAAWPGAGAPTVDLPRMIEGALAPMPADNGPDARFAYPLRGGFQALMDGFLPFLPGELALNTSVVHVSPRARTVRLDDGRTVNYATLISTMPLPQLVMACGEEAPHEVHAAARALRHVSVRCVNLGVARDRISDKHWIYYPEDTVFHRIFLQGNASPYCHPPGGFGLTCEITYGPTKPLPCDGLALIERVVADCKRVGLLREDDKLITANQIDMPCAYVVYDHARAAHVALIREWFAKAGVILAGRYSEWAYCRSDHAFIAGRKAAQQALDQLAPLLARAV